MPAIIERANREHPYDTPQVLAVPVIDANPAYLEWVLASTDDGAEHEQSDPLAPIARELGKPARSEQAPTLCRCGQ
jgi:hypothetical protein